MRIVPDSTGPKSSVDCNSYTRTISFTGKISFFLPYKWKPRAEKIFNNFFLIFEILDEENFQNTCHFSHRQTFSTLDTTSPQLASSSSEDLKGLISTHNLHYFKSYIRVTYAM